MIEIDGVKYELVEEISICTGCAFKLGSGIYECVKDEINDTCGDYIYKRIKEEVMFKKGDRVVCVDNKLYENALVVGKEYIIRVYDGAFVQVAIDYGHAQVAFANRFKPAPQYTTRPIDYTGCDPVIAEHLKRGESILCEDSLGDKFFVAGTDQKYDCYITHGDKDRALFKGTKPIPRKRTETRVKKASEIVAWLECNGYVVDSNGSWRTDGTNTFSARMF